jgi:hypothetical protein
MHGLTPQEIIKFMRVSPWDEFILEENQSVNIEWNLDQKKDESHTHQANHT